ncbi:MAG: DUF1648 domain-containing protein [Planctomycetota bacterium]
MFRHISFAIVLFTACCAAAQLIFWAGKLPQEVPIHFDAAGDPDGWSSRSALIGLNIGLHVFSLLCLPAVGYFSRFLPDSLINMPNKEYWLAGDRREETYRVMDSLLLLTGALTSWLFISIFHLSALVGIGDRQNILPEFGWAIAVYVGLILGGCVWMMLRFQAPPEAPRQNSEQVMEN